MRITRSTGMMAFAIVAAMSSVTRAYPACCRLYDGTRDNMAQQAAEAAKKIGNSSLFQKELANVDALGKLEIDSVFRGESLVSRDLINAIATSNWETLDKLFVTLDIDTKVKAAKDARDTARAELAALEVRLDELKKNLPASPEDPKDPAEAVARVIANAVDADDAAKSLLNNVKGKGGTAAVKLSEVVGQALADANTAAKAVQTNQQSVTDVKRELRKLVTDLTDLSIREMSLKADEQRDRAKIYDRRLQLDTEVKNLIDGYNTLLNGDPQGTPSVSAIDRSTPIIQTINAAAAAARTGDEVGNQRLMRAIGAVFAATSVSARWNSADFVTELRLTNLAHRTSILKSQLATQAFEAAIGNGAQRLAIFYRGGLRPETIAQLVYSFSTAAIPWAIKTQN